MEKRDTVGKIAVTLAKDSCDNTHSPHEQMLEQLSDYDKNIYECVERYKKDFLKDFYVVVITKKERLLENVIRNFFYGRISCPTPDYDQTVYFYNYKTQIINFMWVIPSKDACQFIKENALRLDPSEKELINFVLSFYDGSLLKRCKELNNETEKTGQLLLQ